MATDSSTLLPVLWREQIAMLKVAHVEEEKRGAQQLAWWDGRGAARVFKIGRDAVLMQRANGHSLRSLAEGGRASEAISTICRVAVQLHGALQPPPNFLMPLQLWFQPLLETTIAHAEIRRAASVAAALMANGGTAVPLHGDLHHDNVLDFGEGNWRAIDPKGLFGDRTFDLIHLLRNPDIEAAPRLLRRQAIQVSREADVPLDRLLGWLVAFSGLSWIWGQVDGTSSDADLALLKQALILIDAGS